MPDERTTGLLDLVASLELRSWSLLRRNMRPRFCFAPAVPLCRYALHLAVYGPGEAWTADPKLVVIQKIDSSTAG